jgi:hypothetical protein
MTSHEALRRELYRAFLTAALAMGDDVRGLSWFGRNRKRAAHADNVGHALKKAA